MSETYWPTIEVERMTDQTVLVTLSDFGHKTEQFFLSDSEKAALARQLKAA